MKKIYRIALNEFITTVSSRAFILGLLVLPVIMGISALVIPRLFNPDDFTLAGDIAIIDQSRLVASELNSSMQEEVIEEFMDDEPDSETRQMGREVMERVIDDMIDINIIEQPYDVSVDDGKNWLLQGSKDNKRLALIVIHPDAVEYDANRDEFGSYDLYITSSMRNRAEFIIHGAVRNAIVNARMKAQQIDAGFIDRIMDIKRVNSITVSDQGEQKTAVGLKMMLPMAFMMLMFIGIMGGGQSLMTSTIEEKSSRVIEVLLSAVSPMELMAGKLFGQVAASLLAISVYMFMGMAFLISFSLIGLIDFSLIFYTLLFFLISYFVIGSLMMAIGSVVNNINEAQTLQFPLMILISSPWILWFPVSQNPDSTLSVVTSFIPPINTFVMLLRMASPTPPPMWQVWTTIIIGIVTIYVALWIATKIFRIGLLVYGKPPDFATLFKWIRAA